MYENSDAEADADVNIRKAITHISELQHNQMVSTVASIQLF